MDIDQLRLPQSPALSSMGSLKPFWSTRLSRSARQKSWSSGSKKLHRISRSDLSTLRMAMETTGSASLLFRNDGLKCTRLQPPGRWHTQRSSWNPKNSTISDSNISPVKSIFLRNLPRLGRPVHLRWRVTSSKLLR